VEARSEETRPRADTAASTVVDADPSRRLSGQRPVPRGSKALKRIPTNRRITAQEADEEVRRVVPGFDAGDNLYEFINLHGRQRWRAWCFSDRQAQRIGTCEWPSMEFGFGEGGYPAFGIRQTPYCRKRHVRLPSPTRRTSTRTRVPPQGQAMGVLPPRRAKTLLLTGTLMGGYGDDCSILLVPRLAWADDRRRYRPSKQGSMTSAAKMAFMRDQTACSRTIYSRSKRLGSQDRQGQPSKSRCEP